MASRSWARWALTAVAMLAAGGAAWADRIAYQGEFGPTGRGVLVTNETGKAGKGAVVPLPAGTHGDILTPALSPDGRQIAFSARKGDHYHIFVWELSEDNKVSGLPRQLTDAPANDEQPAWSPDGTRLAFVRASEKEGYGLYTMPVAGGTPVLVAGLSSNFRNACPDWSPDGSRLVYNVDDDLWVAAAKGGETRKLREDGYYPSWSKDGKTIVFFAKKPKPALMAMDVESGQARVLLSGVEGFGETTFSPWGDRILFKATKVAGKPGNHWVVQADGSRLRPLQSEGTAHAYLSWSAQPQPGLPAVAAAVKPTGPVSIVSPQFGTQGLRGFVEVVAAKQKDGGYVTFSVDDVFQVATVSPYKFRWDTRSVEDGEHVIEAAAYDMDALPEGTTRIRVSVRNAIDPASLGPEGIMLALRFKPGETLSYRLESEGKVGGPGEVLTPETSRLNGVLKAICDLKVERTSGDGASAEITGTTRTVSLSRGSREERVPESARAARLQASASGLVEAVGMREGVPRFGVLELCTGLPGRKVTVGDTWQAPLVLVADIAGRQPATATANHVFEGLQWDGDQETAKIRSTYSLPTLTVAGGAVTLHNVTGERLTWVAYKTFRMVRIEETIKAEVRQQLPAATAPGTAASTITGRAAPATPTTAPGLTLRLGGRRDDEGGGRSTPAPTRPTAGPAPTTAPAPTQPPTPSVQYTLTLKLEATR